MTCWLGDGNLHVGKSTWVMYLPNRADMEPGRWVGNCRQATTVDDWHHAPFSGMTGTPMDTRSRHSHDRYLKRSILEPSTRDEITYIPVSRCPISIRCFAFTCGSPSHSASTLPHLPSTYTCIIAPVNSTYNEPEVAGNGTLCS